MDWDKVEWSKFSPQEAHRLRHRMIEEKHRGHDLMHAEMLLILFGSILVAQILLFAWRQKRPRLVYNPLHPLPDNSKSTYSQCIRSYQTVTLFGLWIIPIATSIYFSFWRMIIVWSVFSAITAFVIFKATRRKLSVNTPR